MKRAMTTGLMTTALRSRWRCVAIGVAAAVSCLAGSASGTPLTIEGCVASPTCASWDLVAIFPSNFGVPGGNFDLLRLRDTLGGTASIMRDYLVGPFNIPNDTFPIGVYTGEGQARVTGTVGCRGPERGGLLCGRIGLSATASLTGGLAEVDLNPALRRPVEVNATLVVGWKDTLTIGAETPCTLCPELGLLGVFEVTQFFSLGALFASSGDPNDGFASLSVSVTEESGRTGLRANVYRRAFSLRPGSPLIRFSFSERFFGELGDRLVVESLMSLRGDVRGLLNEGTQFVDIDASSTGGFFIDPVTPGFSYSSASGFTYFTSVPGPAPGPGPAPVPEPASLGMLITGVLGLLAYAWRKTAIAR